MVSNIEQHWICYVDSHWMIVCNEFKLMLQLFNGRRCQMITISKCILRIENDNFISWFGSIQCGMSDEMENNLLNRFAHFGIWKCVCENECVGERACEDWRLRIFVNMVAVCDNANTREVNIDYYWCSVYFFFYLIFCFFFYFISSSHDFSHVDFDNNLLFPTK